VAPRTIGRVLRAGPGWRGRREGSRRQGDGSRRRVDVHDDLGRQHAGRRLAIALARLDLRRQHRQRAGHVQRGDASQLHCVRAADRNGIDRTCDGDYDNTTFTATLRPNAALASSTPYTAIVQNASDLAGNTISGPVRWTFSTGAAGFEESIVFSGLVEPTAIEFALDGRVLVAEEDCLNK